MVLATRLIHPNQMLAGGSAVVREADGGGTTAESGSGLGASLITSPSSTAAGILRGGDGDDNAAQSGSGLGQGCCAG